MDVNTVAKNPDDILHAPPRIHASKATNGVLKRHFLPHAPPHFAYRECLKNFAATIGGHALDGCGEFTPAATATASDPTSLKCAACGCHRNFHRRDPEDYTFPTVSPAIEYRPQHRHQPLPPPTHQARESHSPPPISSSYSRMILPLAHGESGNPRKRFRTKFSQAQKDRMLELAEKVGWKLQKSNEEIVNGICGEIGVERSVFKVWMHNNKNAFFTKPSSAIDFRIGRNEGDDNGSNNYCNGKNEESNNAPNNVSSSSC